jgi:FkbH-like protein
VAHLPSNFNSCRLFDHEHVSDEDRVRSEMMLQESGRKALAQSLSAHEFTKALRLSVEVFSVKPEHHSRVTQLINKTNQFNLTTPRKTAAELAKLCETPGVGVLAWRVSDRFGEYGLVGVVVLASKADAIEIDTFLMSCRVLGRGVESAVFAAMAEYARLLNVGKLRGRYIPTPKNSLVAELYREHGFEAVGDGYWETDQLARFEWPEHITRLGDISA